MISAFFHKPLLQWNVIDVVLVYAGWILLMMLLNRFKK